MMIALIPLPKKNTPVQGITNNLNGYWDTPDFVIEQWSGVCKIEYNSDEDFEHKTNEIKESFNNCIKKFYRENPL